MPNTKRRGQVIPRGDKKWMVRVYAGHVNGKRQYLNQGVYGSRGVAEKMCAKLVREMQDWRAEMKAEDSLERLERSRGVSLNGYEANAVLFAFDKHYGYPVKNNLRAKRSGLTIDELQRLRTKLFNYHEHPPEPTAGTPRSADRLPPRQDSARGLARGT